MVGPGSLLRVGAGASADMLAAAKLRSFRAGTFSADSRLIALPTATALFVVAAMVLLNVVDFVYFEPIPRDVQGLLEELGTVLEREDVRLDLERDREEMLPPYFSLTSPSALLALAAIVLVIIGLSGSASSQFLSRAAIGLAILLLVLRQLSRRLKGRSPRAAQPDPRSTLKLH